MEIITRQEAIAQGLRRYFTGEPCKRGHTAQMWTRSCVCVECNRIYKKAERKRNPEHVRQRKRAWDSRNKERVASSRKERETEADRIKNRERAAAHYWANKAEYFARSIKRQARVKRATPAWADHEKIKTKYKEQQTMSRLTGVPHDVDHVIPLQSDVVCGLHVESNLRVILSRDNRIKSNKWEGSK